MTVDVEEVDVFTKGISTLSEGSGVQGRLSRRQFLRVGGAGIAGIVLAGTGGCGDGRGEQGGSTTLNFVFGPDPTGTLQTLIGRFNRENAGEVRVKWRGMPVDVTQYFSQIRTELQAGTEDVDVIGGELAWAVQFASNGWIADLSDRFTEEVRRDFLQAPLETVEYEDGFYGVPWYTDAGMLYYRKDLLRESGFDEAPRTWNELKQMARAVREKSATRAGFVFQGAEYEGGAINALEYIWTSGGDVLDPEDPARVVINSPESLSGLTTERSMITDGIAPQAVVTYKEDESGGLFLRGDAVFHRNWPYLYGQLNPETSSIEPEQVDISVLPVASEGLRTYSGLGGWNFLVNAGSQKQDAAWEFIRYMTAPEQQKLRALQGGYLPVLKSLYDDQEILDEVPVIALGKEAIQSARPRPVSPFYQDMALVMSEQFHASLNGSVSPEQALQTLQTELQAIVDQSNSG